MTQETLEAAVKLNGQIRELEARLDYWKQATSLSGGVAKTESGTLIDVTMGEFVDFDAIKETAILRLNRKITAMKEHFAAMQ